MILLQLNFALTPSFPSTVACISVLKVLKGREPVDITKQYFYSSAM